MNADLVLEGGGVKGIGLVGAVTALDQAGYSFQRVAGTSAGAIVGAMVAAGMEPAKLEEVMRAVDYRNFRDARFPGNLGYLGKGINLLLRLGIYRGDWLHQFITEQLAGCNVRTFGDLRCPHDPESALPADQNYKLVVIVSDATHNRMLRLPWDYRLLGLDPDEQPVADAVRASASIPFFFEPVRLLLDGRKERTYLTDGGMLSNFPIGVFDRRDGATPRWPTFGVKLSARPSAMLQAKAPGISNPIELGLALIGTMTSAHDQRHLDDPSVLARTMFVDTGSVKATDFSLGEATQDQLYGSGLEAARSFLGSWDFDAYLRKYRLPPATVTS